MSAVQYAGLVGRYVRMTHRPDDEGMECTVTSVRDEPDGGVTIVSDYGYAFTIKRGEDHLWSFVIWPDEVTRRGAS